MLKKSLDLHETFILYWFMHEENNLPGFEFEKVSIDRLKILKIENTAIYEKWTIFTRAFY